LADASNKWHTMWVSCMHVAVCCPCLSPAETCVA
jgi:hypothetical protein